MALSDACFEFMQATADAADALATAIHHYSAPDYPIHYGVEIDALRRACAAIRDNPYDPQTGAELLRLAASVITYHDTPPDTPEALHREVELKRLIRLLEDAVEEDQKATVPAVLENVIVETRFTPQAAERLKSMLLKLGKSAYDIAIKIISDIGSATAKKCWASKSDVQSLFDHHEPSRHRRSVPRSEPASRGESRNRRLGAVPPSSR